MRRLVGSALVVHVVASGCAVHTATEDTACAATHALIGGKSTPTLFPLSDSERAAIVSVVVTTQPGGGAAGICTGVVLAPRTILSARHCFDRDGDGAVDLPSGGVGAHVVVFGDPFDASAQRGAPSQVWLHPTLDVALLEADWLSEQHTDLKPLQANSSSFDSGNWLGSPVELAGFGLSESSGLGKLSFLVEQLTAIESTHLVVAGTGRTGACKGDSGGPLLGRADDGRVRVLGVLDDGDPTCLGRDRYTRLDRLFGWEPFDRLVPAVDVEPACDGLSLRGVCSRGRAMWCEGGQSRVADCSIGDRVCGWQPAARGFRCVAPEEDPCRGLGSAGACDGDEVVSCRDGLPRRVDCGACGARCVEWASAGGAGCAT